MERTVFRPWFGRALTVVVAAICAVGFVALAANQGIGAALPAAPWLALLAGSAWAVFWRPEVVVDLGGVRLVNVFRTIDLPWPAIHAIDTKWALTLITAYGRYTAWAAPAPGVHATRRATRQDTQHLPASTASHEGIRPGDLPSSASGSAALAIRRHWEQLRDAGYLDDPRLEHDRAPVRWHVEIVIGALALVAMAVLALLV